MNKKILVVDDDSSICESIKILLSDYCDVTYFTDLYNAEDYLKNNEQEIDAIILDYNIGSENGIAFYRNNIVKKGLKIPGILISGFIVTQLKTEKELDDMNSLFVKVFEKPFDSIEFKEFITQEVWK
ncbi:MAG: response regulator [bacterium]|nr:response regulator [bacterium]